MPLMLSKLPCNPIQGGSCWEEQRCGDAKLPDDYPVLSGCRLFWLLYRSRGFRQGREGAWKKYKTSRKTEASNIGSCNTSGHHSHQASHVVYICQYSLSLGLTKQINMSYEAAHANATGAGDGRPTAMDIIKDEGLVDKLQGKVFLITGGQLRHWSRDCQGDLCHRSTCLHHLQVRGPHAPRYRILAFPHFNAGTLQNM